MRWCGNDKDTLLCNILELWLFFLIVSLGSCSSFFILKFLIHSASFTIPDLWYIIGQYHPSLILTTCCWKSILVPHISGRAQGYSRMAGSVGCHEPMVPCVLAFIGAVVTLKQTWIHEAVQRENFWATFWAICPLFGRVIICYYPYILVWSGSMSTRTCVKPQLIS